MRLSIVQDHGWQDFHTSICLEAYHTGYVLLLLLDGARFLIQKNVKIRVNTQMGIQERVYNWHMHNKSEIYVSFHESSHTNYHI
jgi:hypothetical protein